MPITDTTVIYYSFITYATYPYYLNPSLDTNILCHRMYIIKTVILLFIGYFIQKHIFCNIILNISKLLLILLALFFFFLLVLIYLASLFDMNERYVNVYTSMIKSISWTTPHIIIINTHISHYDPWLSLRLFCS